MVHINGSGVRLAGAGQRGILIGWPELEALQYG